MSTGPLRITVVEEGSRAELSFGGPGVSLGRAIDNDVRLSSPLVSRHHCRIELGEEGAVVVDLGSANGVLCNGIRVQRAVLKTGDELAMGGARILIDAAPEVVLDASPEKLEQQTTVSAPATERARRRGRVAEAAASAQLGPYSTRLGGSTSERTRLLAFAEIARAIVRETELSPLLRQIVDSAVALLDGERGFLILTEERPANAARSPEGGARLSVRVARSFDRTDIPMPSSRLSSGISGSVLETGRPVLSVDAGRDERFSAMGSVEDLRLRSVLCVPVVLEERVAGVLYVDNRMQAGAFDESDLELLELFAGQAAVAIRNARLLEALRERNKRLAHSRAQIEGLNLQLGRKVRDRDTELAIVRAELGRERGRYDYSAIVGSSEGMRLLFATLDRVIETDLPLLIHGESGTGKELIARAVHHNGRRQSRPFVSINCAALPDSLLESELFGHTRGAFTGADRAKKGLLEQATGGTLFLDEIGDMSSEMQKKFLRVLQDGEVRPLGSNITVAVDVRLLAASHRDLEELVRRGEFREDLYYRINVLQVRLPPLRERREDVPLLAEALLARAARETSRDAPVLGPEALAALVDHDWPGNVRELENEMRRLVVLCEGEIGVEQLSPSIAGQRAGNDGLRTRTLEAGGNLRASVAGFERTAIETALETCSGNKSRAAARLGLSRFALQRKMEKYGLGEGVHG